MQLVLTWISIQFDAFVIVVLSTFYQLVATFVISLTVAWELSGRVLDSGPRVAGLSLTGVTALCP